MFLYHTALERDSIIKIHRGDTGRQVFWLTKHGQTPDKNLTRYHSLEMSGFQTPRINSFRVAESLIWKRSLNR
jgi:hypothetical protein